MNFDEKHEIKKLFYRIFKLYMLKRHSYTFEYVVDVFIGVLNEIILEKQYDEEKEGLFWDSPLSLKRISIKH